jgi:cytochrome P450
MVIDDSVKATVNFRGRMAAQVDELLLDPEASKRAEHETVYHHLMTRQPGKGQHEIPSRNSLLSEGVSLVVAGSDAGGGTLTVGVFHVLRNKSVSSTLIKELEAAWPDKDAPMKLEDLEKLPYLVGVCYLRIYTSNAG